MNEQATLEADELQARQWKLEQLRLEGLPAYPNDFRKSTNLRALQESHGDWSSEQFEAFPVTHRVAGRCKALRRMGKLIFGRIRDESGQIQLIWSEKLCGAESFNRWKKFLDVGDILGVEGRLCRTRTGELSLQVQKCFLLTKALRPMPDKFHGLTDSEMCQRQRYLDLIGNESTFRRFQIRARLIQSLRQELFKEGFLEFETPMMQPIPGGAAARPFITHHHALQRDLYLRVSPELYLKRLLVGGFEKVFELNRSFRNEGVSTRHNPEFTMLEFYEAFVGYEEHMARVETLLSRLYTTLKQEFPELLPLDFQKPFQRQSFDALVEGRWRPGPKLTPLQGWREQCQAHELPIHPQDEVDDLKLKLFEAFVEPKLIEPTFVTGYPAKVSPLSRRSDESPDRAERFELFVNGIELANGFSELNNPETQAENFYQQVQAREGGNEEAMFFDADYIEALKVGLPPAAGTGIGIDRLVMWLTQSTSIREVLLFPALRQKYPEGSNEA